MSQRKNAIITRFVKYGGLEQNSILIFKMECEIFRICNDQGEVMKNEKLIFVTGGVLSSLGKGVVCNYNRDIVGGTWIKADQCKMDPYINVDPGTMSPYQRWRSICHR